MKLIKPNICFHQQYLDMMEEWLADGSRLAPWTVSLPYKSADEFAALIARCEEVERGENLDGYAANSTWWLYDEEQDKLIGVGNLRHWLNDSDGQLWGHIGYGIRPSERRKGKAAFLLQAMLYEAKTRDLAEVLLAAYSSNIGSWKTMERCGAEFLRTVLEDPSDPQSEIRQYIIRL